MEEDLQKNRLGAKADLDFHVTIAEATHNELYVHVMHTIYDLLQEQFRNAWGGVFRKRDRRKKLLHQHQNIFIAIKEHNPKKGAEEARRHFNYVGENWEDALMKIVS